MDGLVDDWTDDQGDDQGDDQAGDLARKECFDELWNILDRKMKSRMGR